MDVLGLLAVGGDVAADRGEAPGAGVASELAADLGSQLDHAQVALCLVVVEREGEVGRVGEEQIAVLCERDRAGRGRDSVDDRVWMGRPQRRLSWAPLARASLRSSLSGSRTGSGARP